METRIEIQNIHLHFECKQIEHGESFGKTISKNASWITATNLIGWQ